MWIAVIPPFGFKELDPGPLEEQPDLLNTPAIGMKYCFDC